MGSGTRWSPETFSSVSYTAVLRLVCKEKKKTTQDISVINMVTNKCKTNKKSKTGFGNASMTRHHTFSITFFKVANCFVWILKANKGTWQLEGEMPCSLTSSAQPRCIMCKLSGLKFVMPMFPPVWLTIESCIRARGTTGSFLKPRINFF